MSKHRKTEARAPASKPARKRTAAAALPEPDYWLQHTERDKIYLARKAPLTPGCHVAVVHQKKKPQLGRYWPGPPAQFAEIIDYWDNQPDAKLRKPTRIPATAEVFRWVGTARANGPAGRHHRQC